MARSIQLRVAIVLLVIAAYFCLLVFFPWDLVTRPGTGAAERGLPVPVVAAPVSGRAVEWGLIEHRAGARTAVDSYRALAQTLGKALGVEVRVRRVAGYQELEQEFVSGRLDLASFSSFAYVALRKKHPEAIRPLVTETYQGSRYYVGYFFTRAQSQVRTLADLEGRSFAFVSRRSASGYLFPRAHIREQGFDPGSFFSRVVFSGSHVETIRLVRQGRVDGGVTFDASFQGLPFNDFRIIAKTARVPGGVLCASKNLPEGVSAAVQSALMRLSRENSPMMQDFRQRTTITGWAPVTESDYVVVRRALVEKAKP